MSYRRLRGGSGCGTPCRCASDSRATLSTENHTSEGDQLASDDQINLRGFDSEILLEEIRKRRLDSKFVVGGLGLAPKYAARAESRNVDLRHTALLILAALAVIILIVISVLAIQGLNIPDLLSGLAGSCIGAVAGILSGGEPKESDAKGVTTAEVAGEQA